MGAMMNKIPAPQQQPPQQINQQPPVIGQYNSFENVVPNQMPGTQMPGTQMPGVQMPGVQMPGTQLSGAQMPATDIPPNMFKMQRGKSKKLL